MAGLPSWDDLEPIPDPAPLPRVSIPAARPVNPKPVRSDPAPSWDSLEPMPTTARAPSAPAADPVEQTWWNRAKTLADRAQMATGIGITIDPDTYLGRNLDGSLITKEQQDARGPQVSATPVRGWWDRAGDAASETFDTAGRGVNALVMRGDQEMREDALIEQMVGLGQMSPADAAAAKELNRRRRANVVLETRGQQQVRDADEAARNPGLLAGMGRFTADMAGGLVGDANPSYAIAPAVGAVERLAGIPLVGGALSSPTFGRMVGQGAVNAGTDAVTQGAEISEGIQDGVDPGRLATNMLAGMVMQGLVEGAGAAASRFGRRGAAGEAPIPETPPAADARPDANRGPSPDDRPGGGGRTYDDPQPRQERTQQREQARPQQEAPREEPRAQQQRPNDDFFHDENGPMWFASQKDAGVYAMRNGEGGKYDVANHPSGRGFGLQRNPHYQEPTPGGMMDELLRRRAAEGSKAAEAFQQAGKVDTAPIEKAWADLEPVPDAAPIPEVKVPPAKAPAPTSASAPVEGAVGRFMAKTKHAESGGKANAKNSRSSAEGLYQFTDGTWKATYRARFGKGETDDQILAKKYDPALQETLMRDLTEANRKSLEGAGITADEGNLYLAHFAGEAGARKLYRADPNAAVDKVLGARVVNANPQLKGKTVGETIAWARGKMGGTARSEGDVPASEAAPIGNEPAIMSSRDEDAPVPLAEVEEAPAPAPMDDVMGMNAPKAADTRDWREVYDEADAKAPYPEKTDSRGYWAKGYADVVKGIEPSLPSSAIGAKHAPRRGQEYLFDAYEAGRAAAASTPPPAPVTPARSSVVSEPAEPAPAFPQNPIETPQPAGQAREKPTDALEFIARSGGLRDDEGHNLGLVMPSREKTRGMTAGGLAGARRRKAFGTRNWRTFTKAGPLLRHKGQSVDRIGEALHEAGYLRGSDGGRPTEAEVLDYIEARMQSGKPAYPEGTQVDEFDDVPDEVNADAMEHEQRRIAIDDAADRMGLEPLDEDFSHMAAEIHKAMPDKTPREALMRAINEHFEDVRQRGFEEANDQAYDGGDYDWPDHPEPQDQAPASAGDGEGRAPVARDEAGSGGRGEDARASEPAPSLDRGAAVDPGVASRQSQEVKLRADAPMRARKDQDGTMGTGLFDTADQPGFFQRFMADEEGALHLDKILNLEGITKSVDAVRKAVGDPMTAMRTIAKTIHDMGSWAFYSADSRGRLVADRIKSQAAHDYLDNFFARPGKDGPAVGETYHEAVQRHGAGPTQETFRVLQRHGILGDAAKEKFVVQLLRKTRRGRAGSPETLAATELRDLLKTQIDYRKGSGEEIGEVTDGYFPRWFDVDKVVSNEADWLARAERLYASIGAADPAGQAKLWFNHIFDTYAGLDGGLDIRRATGDSTGSNTAKSREFGKLADDIMGDYYQGDLMQVMGSYFHGSARRAEQTRRFGRKGAAFSPERRAWTAAHGDKTQLDVYEAAIRDDARAAGADGAGALGMFQTIHNANLGRASDMSRGLRVATSWMHTWTQLGVMDKAALTSLGEITGGFVRGGPRHGLPFVAETVKQFYRQLGHAAPDDAQRWAEALGVAQDALVNDALVSRAGIEYSSAGSQKLLSRFYKATLLHQYTEATRIAAVRMSQELMRQWSGDLMSTNARTRARAERYLREVGVSDPQAMGAAVRAGGFNIDDVKKDVGSLPHEYGAAVVRITNQTILRPTRAEKPTWANSGVGSLFFSLMSYSYGFKKNVLDRMGRMAVDAVKEKDMHLLYPAFGLAMLFAVQGVNDTYLRPALFGGGDRLKGESVGAATLRIADRAGFLPGFLSTFNNAVTGVKYQRSLTESLAGPVLGRPLDMAKKAVALGTDTNSPKTNTAERAFAGALYDNTVEPAADALAVSWGAGPLATAGVFATGNRKGGLAPADRDWFMDTVAGKAPPKRGKH